MGWSGTGEKGHRGDYDYDYDTPHSTPYTLHPTPYTLHRIIYTLYHHGDDDGTHNLYPIPHSLCPTYPIPSQN